MTQPREQTQSEVDALLAFLPGFEKSGRKFIERWGGGDEVEPGVIQWPYPDYCDYVRRFFHRFAEDGWQDPDYSSVDTDELAEHPERLKTASFKQVRAVLTWCCRGERFCDGHWGACLKSGLVQAALRRLAALRPARNR
jgi:hypothetical protein